MKNSDRKRILIIGIGNDSRQDDGLGWSLLARIRKGFGSQFELVYRYQLNIEDADLIQDADLVVFLDAYRNELKEGYALEPCNPNGEITFTTHALSPSAVLALCNQIFLSHPKSYVLKIQGYEWELKTGLTKPAKINLEKAFNNFKNFIENQ